MSLFSQLKRGHMQCTEVTCGFIYMITYVRVYSDIFQYTAMILGEMLKVIRPE